MKRSLKWIVSVMAMVLMVQVASASTTTIINVTSADVTNTVESSDYAPGFASGSLQANATTAGAKSEYYVSDEILFGRNITISEIASITYYTKTGTTHTVSTADWYLAIYTAPDSSLTTHGSWYGNRITTEPYFAQNLTETAGTWTQWTTEEGENNRLRFFDSTNNSYFGSYTDGFLSDLTSNSAYANQSVLCFSVQTGSAWAYGFTGLIDGITITLTDGSVAQMNFVPEPTTMLILGLGAVLCRKAKKA